MQKRPWTYVQDLFVVYLVILTLSSSFRLFLTSNAGLLVMLTLTHLTHDARLGYLSLKSAECVFKRFVFLDSDFCHFISLPSLSAKELYINSFLLYTIQTYLSSAFDYFFRFLTDFLTFACKSELFGKLRRQSVKDQYSDKR
jgi:hypothetical protein